MKKAVTIISIIAVLIIAAVVLALTGNIDLSFFNGSKNAETVNASACISYMNTYVLIEDKGKAIATSEDQPDDIPLISGVDLKTMVIGEVVEPDDARSFSYAENVVRELKKAGISGVGEIFVSSDHEITLYLKDADIRILIGKEEKTAEKFGALVNFYDKLKEYSGTLNLQEVSDGYTLKLNDVDLTEETDETGEETGEDAESYEE